MGMSDDDICGSENTSSGDPCQFSPAESCPWHDVEEVPDTGRDSKLTRERQEAIAAMIEAGHSVTAAARSNGVTKQTVMNWLGRGEEQEEGIYAEFFARYTHARGEGEKQYLELIKDMAMEEGDHRFLASLMKQRYPDSWAEDDDSPGVDTDAIVINVPEDAKRKH